ncbi:hypothetical protein ABZ801_29115 [Actinomadura sp. NPDC047616]|uniref:hypothetical protein n=1 Tax=Actinomadura sp. NPDC047616 TaxID=3155914 RepID=UPI0033FF570D
MAGLTRATGAATALAGTIVLAACGSNVDKVTDQTSPPPSSTGAATAEPSSGERLVLRWRRTGGIAGFGGPGALPDFSLYGDGRAIFVPDGGDRRATEYRLRPDALRRLLDQARAAGLDRSRTIAPDEQVMDAPVLEITMGAARTRVVMPEEHDGPVTRFQKRLYPTGWAEGDQAGPGRPYRPARVAVLAGRFGADVGSGDGQGVKTWPLAPLDRGERVAGGLCTVLTGRDAATAERLAASGSSATPWRSGAHLYSVRFRPLLPDETACADIARP